MCSGRCSFSSSGSPGSCCCSGSSETFSAGHDIGGGGKTLWLIFVIIVPFLGVFIYLIAEDKGMTERSIERAQASQQQFDDYMRSTASGGGSAAEIEKAKQLLDSGAITQAEFDQIKQKALA